MDNIAQYDDAFLTLLQVDKDSLATLKYQDIPTWDSIGHMALITTLEEKFEIELDIDDIIDFSSYNHGKSILNKYGIKI
jgi:acyl carrier protein